MIVRSNIAPVFLALLLFGCEGVLIAGIGCNSGTGVHLSPIIDTPGVVTLHVRGAQFDQTCEIEIGTTDGTCSSNPSDGIYLEPAITRVEPDTDESPYATFEGFVIRGEGYAALDVTLTHDGQLLFDGTVELDVQMTDCDDPSMPDGVLAEAILPVASVGGAAGAGGVNN